MIITINGKEGSGKSTVAKMLADELHLTYYDIGGLRRHAAKEKGMTLEEYNTYGETHDETDREVDAYQKKLGVQEDNIIVSGRTSFHFIPHSIKLYLDVSPEAAAKRIFSDDNLATRNERNDIGSIEDIQKGLRERVKSDTKRYKQYYDLDIHDLTHYDFIVDTSDISAEAVFKKILDFLKTHKHLTTD